MAAHVGNEIGFRVARLTSELGKLGGAESSNSSPAEWRVHASVALADGAPRPLAQTVHSLVSSAAPRVILLALLLPLS